MSGAPRQGPVSIPANPMSGAPRQGPVSIPNNQVPGAARPTSGVLGKLANAGSMVTGNAGNRSWTVTFNDLPKNLNTLRTMQEASLREPHFAAALLIPALCLWPTNESEALAMINFLKGPEALSTRDIQFIRDRLRGKEYVPFSYLSGSAPHINFEPLRPYTFIDSVNPFSFHEQGYAKLHLLSSGADSPRPVQLRLKPSTGEWFLWEQMLLSDIRQPIAQDNWA